MALTTEQITRLNSLADNFPNLGKGKTSTGPIMLGNLLAGITPTTIAAPAAVAPVVAAADATYGQPEADLINELRTWAIAATALLNELRANQIAAAAATT
jgi:hypothetical protein